MFKRIINFLTSLRLTVVILAVMIITAVPSTLIIQNQSPDYYHSVYSGTAAGLILFFGYDHFFSSILFISITAAFWINLFSCTLRRFTAQLRKGRRGRFGPDLLHLGLLVLIIGAVVTFAGRKEGMLYLKVGDIMELPSGRYLILNDFQFEQYPDGRPKSWISEVLIAENQDDEGELRQIEVNRPLRIDGLVIYQASYRPSSAAETGVYETGLMVTYDPGKSYLIISFILIAAGMFFTMFGKWRKSM